MLRDETCNIAPLANVSTLKLKKQKQNPHLLPGNMQLLVFQVCPGIPSSSMYGHGTKSPALS